MIIPLARTKTTDFVPGRSDWLEYVPCALCGASDEQLLFHARDKMLNRPGSFPAVRCRRCGLVYLNPRPGPEARALFYGERYRFSAGNPGQSQPLEHYLPVVDFLAGEPAGRILDVGTGNSPFLPAMRQLGWEVAGTEIDASLVEYFRSHYQIELFQGELESAQFSSGYFDVVTIMGVLEHVRHPRLFMEEVARILKDGGVVCLWCFNRSVEAGLLGRYWLGFDAPRHLYSFSHETLRRLLAETGFKVEKSYFRPISYLAYSAMWAAARLGDRWKGRSRPVYLSRLPAPLELLSLPLASVLARMGKSSNIYVFARKL